MYLVEAEERIQQRPEEQAPGVRLPSAKWQDFPYSCLSHHGEACCEVAKEWVIAMDFAQLNGGGLSSGPRWVRQRYKWGPTAWPAFWCEVVKREAIDCGAHAAIALELFTARGLKAYPAQLVQQYSSHATEEWRGKWMIEDVSCHWIDGDIIYHEGTALLSDGDDVKLWDASAGSWINPHQSGGYGSLLAVRIFANEQIGGGDGFRWGERRIKPNEWVQI